ncbi:hypothetical protein ACOMHN_017449 [Nucella lapillus]
MAVHQSVWLCCAHRGHGGASVSVAVLCSQRPWRCNSQCGCAVLTHAGGHHARHLGSNTMAARCIEYSGQVIEYSSQVYRVQRPGV